MQVQRFLMFHPDVTDGVVCQYPVHNVIRMERMQHFLTRQGSGCASFNTISYTAVSYDSASEVC